MVNCQQEFLEPGIIGIIQAYKKIKFALAIIIISVVGIASANGQPGKISFPDTVKTTRGALTELVISLRNKKIEIIRLENGLKHGEQETFYYNTGKIASRINYKNGQLHGESSTFDYQGDLNEKKNYRYNSRTKTSQLQGEYLLYKNKVLQLRTTYKDSMKHGRYEEFYQDGKPKIVAHYKQDMLTGTKKYYNYQGMLISENNYTIINKDGKKQSVLHGKYVSYDNVGNYNKIGTITEEGTYKHGRKEGSWKSYERGILRSEIIYKNNKRFGPYKYFHENGSVRMTGNYYDEIVKDGKTYTNIKDGKAEEFHPNGKIATVSFYDMGKKQGFWERYSDYGILMERTAYRNNLNDGKTEYYDEKGNKTYEANYIIIKPDTIEI